MKRALLNPLWGLLLSTTILFTTAAFAQPGRCVPGSVMPVAPGEDIISSLGQFEITITPGMRPAFAGYPGYNAVTGVLTSPVLFDPASRVGRSGVIIGDSPAGKGGTP